MIGRDIPTPLDCDIMRISATNAGDLIMKLAQSSATAVCSDRCGMKYVSIARTSAEQQSC